MFVFAELQRSRMSAQVTKCLVFLVSLARRTVQCSHRDYVNLFENGEMEAKMKGQGHPNCTPFTDGFKLLENRRLWKVLQNWQGGHSPLLFSEVACLFYQCFFLSNWLCLHRPIVTCFKTSYCWNFWVVVVEILGPCIPLCHSEHSCSCCCARLGEFQNRICMGSICVCRRAEDSQEDKAIFNCGISAGICCINITCFRACKSWYVCAMVSEQPVC